MCAHAQKSTLSIKFDKNVCLPSKTDGWVKVPRPGNKESSRETIVGGKRGGPALEGLVSACPRLGAY